MPVIVVAFDNGARCEVSEGVWTGDLGSEIWVGFLNADSEHLLPEISPSDGDPDRFLAEKAISVYGGAILEENDTPESWTEADGQIVV